jgi:hypothetical protein
MIRSLLLTASFAVACAACSSSTSSGAGAGGHGTTTSTTTKTGTGGEATSSASSSSSSTGTGGGDAGATCSDPTNPMFDSCLKPFLAGCWAPDTTGACSSVSGTVAWADGSKYETLGSAPGLYGPGDTTPCISLTLGSNSFTAKKGTETLSYVADGTTQTGTITCPDGTSFTATSAQVTAFNTCVGLNCP